MPGMGTAVNVAAIVAGGLAGLAFGRLLKENIQKSLMIVLSISTIYIAVQGIRGPMLAVNPDGTLETKGHMVLLFSLVLGTVVGEILNIDQMFTDLGIFLKVKTHSTGDAKFVDAFVSASLTVAVGAMAIMGSIQDGIFGDPSILYVKAVLDMIIIMIMASVMGKGAIFSAIPVGVLQGCMTVFAQLLSPVFTDAALNNISLIGSVLILLVGVNIARPGTVKVANMLPSLIVAILWAYMPWA